MVIPGVIRAYTVSWGWIDFVIFFRPKNWSSVEINCETLMADILLTEFEVV